MMELLDHLAIGFGVAVTAQNLMYCLAGVTLGTFIGVLPGVGPLATISMLLPLTYYLEPVTALIMLAGVFYGAMYGSSATSVLMNLPGTAASAVVCLDGHPMARQGRAGQALVASAFASFSGACITIIIMALFAPPLASWALAFGPAEYFSLMVLGLLAAVMLTRGDMFKGLAMVGLGLVLGLVGIDVNSGEYRFTLGLTGLADGVNFVVIAMGIYGLGEIVSNLERGRKGEGGTIGYRFKWRDLLLRGDDAKRFPMATLRGTGIGAVLGILPGAGTTISSYAAYMFEKQCARDPSRFGNGAIEGVIAPEAANNSAANTAFIPTLTLGIPGDSVSALMLAAIMIHGIHPGPEVMSTQPQLFWGLLASMVVGNLLLLILNLPLIGIWVRVLSIPYSMLYPPVILFICVGVYSLRNNIFDVGIAALFGALGYVLNKLKCEPAPLLLGFILGPMMEENFRRAMIFSRGSLNVFIEEPISLGILIATALMVVASGVAAWRDSPRRVKPAPKE